MGVCDDRRMDWREAARLADIAQRATDRKTMAVSVMEAPTRFFATYQPRPVTVDGEEVIEMAIPHMGLWEVDRATGEVHPFTALPGQRGTEDFWDATRVWRHPACVA